jgi:hypothetical protein
MDPAMSIALSDTQVDHILLVSRPLAPTERAAFMARLFEDLLNRREEVGDGELGRMLRDLQRRYFQPPSDAEAREVSDVARMDVRGIGFRLHHLRRELARRSAR